MKRTNIIIACIVIVVGVAAYVIFHGGGSSGITTGPNPDEQNMSQISGGVDPSLIPPGGSITIGTAKGNVTTKNFYKTALGLVEGTDLVMVQNANYEIDYSSVDSSFAITMAPNVPATMEVTAESDLLNTLGVSTADACRLSVLVYEGSQARALSFCK